MTRKPRPYVPVHVPRHGQAIDSATGMRYCPICYADISPEAPENRVFCSGRCRQASYKRRARKILRESRR